MVATAEVALVAAPVRAMSNPAQPTLQEPAAALGLSLAVLGATSLSPYTRGTLRPTILVTVFATAGAPLSGPFILVATVRDVQTVKSAVFSASAKETQLAAASVAATDVLGQEN